MSGRPLKKAPNKTKLAKESDSRPETDAPSPTLKIVLLGDSGVGKTCLRSQFVHHVFSNAYKATIGGDYLTTTVDLDAGVSRDQTPHDDHLASNRPKSVSLQVWDTAGQERFNSISQAFYRGADVAVLVYDITSYESLLSVRDWFTRFMEHCQVSSPGIVIVGNKLDRAADRVIDKHEVQDVLCRNATVPMSDHVGDWAEDVVEVSCKTLEPVEALFRRVALVGLAKSHVNRQGKYNGASSVILGDSQAVSSRCAC